MRRHLAIAWYPTGRPAVAACGRKFPRIPLYRANVGEGAVCRSCERILGNLQEKIA